MVQAKLPLEFWVALMEKKENEDVIINEEEWAEFQFDSEKMVELEKLHVHNSKHLRALNINVNVNARPISKVLVDGWFILNLIPYRFFRKLGRRDEEIIPSNI